MSEQSFTPGPWTASWSKYDEGVVIVQAGMPSMRVLARFDGDGDGPDEQSLADAHLIAAAPDLLAALKAVHEPYRHLTDEALEAGILMEFGPPKPEKGDALLLVRAAIAKAEGRS